MAPSIRDLARRALEALGIKSEAPAADGMAATSPGAAATAAVITAPAARSTGATPSAPAAGGTQGHSWVSFEAHGPQWGFAFWELSAADRARLVEGGQTLRLRIADVTGLNGQDSSPHALQQLPVEATAGQWGVALPLGNRIYRVELGFQAAGGWVLLARSTPTLIPGYDEAPSTASPTSFEPFQAVEAAAEPLLEPAASAGLPLHELMYRTATLRLRQVGRGSEAFHELELMEGAAAGLQASGVGLWASGRNASGEGLLVRQRSFWLVADAELVVYGATEPDASLSIGGEPVPLKADGSFRVQVPFRDGRQLYPIEAVAADGEQRRSIRLEFERSTPEDHTNPAAEARSEWF